MGGDLGGRCGGDVLTYNVLQIKRGSGRRSRSNRLGATLPSRKFELSAALFRPACHRWASYLTLHRAATPEERQGVVANVETCFRREGQGVGKHYFRWETDDGATPADVECIVAGDDLPWLDKALLDDGSKYKYYMVKDASEPGPIASLVLVEHSDAVWSLALFGADQRRGNSAMGVLLKHAFLGRESDRVLCLEAADGAQNDKLCAFYMRTGWMQPQCYGKSLKCFPELAAGGPHPKFGATDLKHLRAFLAKVCKGNRPFSINLAMFNAQQEVAGVPFTTAITVAAVRRAELDDAPATELAPARALSEQGIADAAYEARLKSLTPKGLDFVNKNRLWPPYRTSMNPMAQHDGKTEETRKKGDWSAQRSRFIREIFNEMFTLHPERYTGTDGADALFDGGCYGWLQQTSQVINAVMLKYGAGSQVGKALTALMGLCEIKRYLDAKQ